MTYGITGIKQGLGPGEQVPIRREIDEWWFSKDENDLNQRSLFIYALHDFMSMEVEPKKGINLSYFGIAGIHGQPLTPWDTAVPKDWYYCAHGTTLFPTWHRPYILLYEQRLYETMLKLIPTTFADSDQKAMVFAAETWRLPFWDWAMKKPDWGEDPDSPKNSGPNVGPNVPFILTQKKIEVKTKTGAALVDNPMWKFVLPDNKIFGAHGIEDQDDKQYSACKATSRHPSTYNPKDPRYNSAWVNGEELNWRTITGELRGAKAIDSNTLPEAVYRLFSYRPSYTEFGTEGWEEGQPPRTYSSLEGVHGDLHGFIGGSGQMGQVAVAAFDPVFWLHHCNIDRLLAMWQDLYPEKYMEWINNTKGLQDGSTQPLAPFHINEIGKSYDSVSYSFQQKDLGYTYPELQQWLDTYKTDGVFDKEKYQRLLRKTIELKYSTTGKSALQLPKHNRVATAHMSAMTLGNLAVENFPSALAEEVLKNGADRQQPLASPPEASWEENDYIVDVVYDRFALGGYSYIIRIFLGDVPEGPPYYFEDTPTEVGFVYNFSSPVTGRGTGPEGCENCKTQEATGALSSGQVILTDYLAENIAKQRQLRGAPLTSLARDEVIAYLKRNLHWRISDQHDVTVPKENMPSLKVSVATTKVTHYAEAARFSEYGKYEVLWAVTENRLAGANPGDLGL